MGSPENNRAEKTPASFGDTAAAFMAESHASLPSGTEQSASWRKMASEFTGTMSASVAGAVAWNLIGRSELGVLTLPVRIAGTALASGLTRAGTQGAAESLLLKPEEHTDWKANFKWGIVDGFAGVAGAAAETRAGTLFQRKLGTQFLGEDLGRTSSLVGQDVIANSLAAKMKYNVIRGVAGGTVGSLAWSLPHEIYNNRNDLDTASGWMHVGEGTAINTLIGGATGGILSGGFTAARNAGDIYKYGAAHFSGDGGTSRLNIGHFNDLHSTLFGDRGSISQLSQAVKDLRATSAEKGITSRIFNLGDEYSGNVAATQTQGGYVENKAIHEIIQVDASVPGNHSADATHGKADFDRWMSNMARINAESTREFPGVSANIKIPGHPDFIGPEGQIYKPYRITSMTNANGVEEPVGVIGLSTHELASMKPIKGTSTFAEYVGEVAPPGHQPVAGEIAPIDGALVQAKKYVEELNAQGVKKIIVLSHLGRDEDVRLAQEVAGISYIASAHSHQQYGLWVKNPTTGWDVPVVQAGSQAGWLAESKLALKDTGAVDKYRSTLGLRRMNSDVAHDPEMDAFVSSAVSGIKELQDQHLPTTITGSFSMTGIRGDLLRQTQLGSLVSKGLLEGVNNNLDTVNAQLAASGIEPIAQPLNIIFKHAGDIRAGLGAGTPSRVDTGNMFLNGFVDNELAAVRMNAPTIKNVLEFSVAEFDKPVHLQQQEASLASRAKTTAKELFTEPTPEPIHDYNGNFLQTEGLKYSVDLSQPIGVRISDIKVRNPATGQYEPMTGNGIYDVLTLFHPVDKWAKAGAFGSEIQRQVELNPNTEAHYNFVEAKPIKLEQPALMEQYLTDPKWDGRISPDNYISDNITNKTPPRIDPSVKPGRIGAMTGIGGASVADSTKEKPDQNR